MALFDDTSGSARILSSALESSDNSLAATVSQRLLFVDPDTKISLWSRIGKKQSCSIGASRFQRIPEVLCAEPGIATVFRGNTFQPAILKCDVTV